MKPITEIAQSLGLSSDDIDLYSKYKAKVSFRSIRKFSEKPQSKYIDVTAITHL